MPSTQIVTKAMRDEELRDRLVSTAIILGIDDPEVWVASNMTKLVVAPVVEGGASTVVSVYEFADASYQPTPLPGANPAAVTDAHLAFAVQKILDDQANPPA